MNQTYISDSPAMTEQFAKQVAVGLKGGDVIAFHGGMGVGKTAFVRGLAEGLAVRGEVCSPTFALVHEYKGPLTLFHFDLYRIADPDDLYSTGFFDYLELPNAILAIEWSERVLSELPSHTIHITLTALDENRREIRVEEGSSCTY